MDEETGEAIIPQKDSETGEERSASNSVNYETGENEASQLKQVFRIDTSQSHEGPIRCQIKRYHRKNNKKGLKRKIQRLQENGEHESVSPRKSFRIDANAATRKQLKGTRKTPRVKKTQASNFIIAVVFLIPTMIIFTPLLGMVVLTSATLLHRYGHYQNKKLFKKGESSIYYHDPLFLVWKEFCPLCKDRDMYYKYQTQNSEPNKLNIMQVSLRRVVL